MPAKSKRQQRYLYWKFGEAWVKKHHFNNEFAPDTKPKKRKTRGRKKK